MTSPLSTSSRFPKTARLRKSPEFDRVQRGGKRVGRRLFVVAYRRNEQGRARIGLSVSRKVGGAVLRNRVKRWIRETARQHMLLRSDLGERGGVDIVFIARPDSASASYSQLRDEVAAVFEIIGRDLLKEST